MVFHAAIDILPLPALLDPQGKAVTNNLPNIGLGQLTNVRIGKHITLDIEAESRAEAERRRRAVLTPKTERTFCCLLYTSPSPRDRG